MKLEILSKMVYSGIYTNMEIETIFDNDELYRRITEKHIKEDGCISSAAFQNTSNTDEMSVDLAKITTIEKTTLNNPKYGVASLMAIGARNLDQKVFHSPEQDNPAHSTVKGRKNARIKKALAKVATLIHFPEGFVYQ
jgi:hypothetical protein